MKVQRNLVMRHGWPAGPWDGEPDMVEWTDAETGLFCLIRRNPFIGTLRGYVGVPPGHSCHGKDCDDLSALEVHGGVTFAGHADWMTDMKEPEAPPGAWLVGFDCSHAFDDTPGLGLITEPLPVERVYKTVEYVQAECAYLAKQLAAEGNDNG